MAQNTTSDPWISVIIPVYNEAAIIGDTLAHVRERAGDLPVEIIVADGGPGHATADAVDEVGITVLRTPPGRGCQMNAGAAVARGAILLFLHADTRLPERAFQSVLWALAGDAVAGAFDLSIDSDRLSLKVIARFANLRSRLERVPYGDQAPFIKADVLRRLGGYPDIPIMEDVELFRTIRLEGLPIILLEDRVVTSARRWEDEGVIRRTLRNWWLRIRHRFGVSPTELARHYRPPGSEE